MWSSMQLTSHGTLWSGSHLLWTSLDPTSSQTSLESLMMRAPIWDGVFRDWMKWGSSTAGLSQFVLWHSFCVDFLVPEVHSLFFPFYISHFIFTLSLPMYSIKLSSLKFVCNVPFKQRYGDIPAHNLLWTDCQKTATHVGSRLAIIPMVQVWKYNFQLSSLLRRINVEITNNFLNLPIH